MTRPTSDDDAERAARPIRSYKARQGRLSDRTLSAIQAHWSTHGIGPAPIPGSTPPSGRVVAVDLESEFGGRPVIIEIGSGMGDAAVAMAAADPDIAVLAIEIHTRGIARTLAAAADRELDNLKVAATDAAALVGALPVARLAGVRGYFPDPWPKARHRKRRLFDQDFVALIAERLADGGTLHLATDIDDYAEQIVNAVTTTDAFAPAIGDDVVIHRPDWRPVTKYEQIALDAGRCVTDVLVQRRARVQT